MSDPFRPSPSEIMDFSKSIGHLFFSISDKIIGAEATTQFNNTQESLRRSTNQFMLDLQSDPDWNNYGEKATKFIDQQNQMIDKMVTNGAAKQQILSWWMDSRDTIMSNVGKSQLVGRQNETIGTYNQNVDSLVKNVSQDPDTRKAKWETFTSGLVRGNIITLADAEKYRKNAYSQIETSDLMNKAADVAKNQGQEAAIEFIDKSTHLYPNIDEAGFDRIARQVTALDTMRRAAANRQAKDNNDKIESKITDFERNGDRGGALHFLSDAKFQDIDGGEAGARVWQYWYNELTKKEKENGPKSSLGDTAEFKELMVASHQDGVDPAPLIKKAREYARRGLIDWKGEYGEDGIEAALDKKVMDKAAPYLDEFKDITNQVQNMKTDQQEAVRSALAYQGSKFKQWVSTHMDVSEDDMRQEAERRHKLAMKGIVEEAAKNIPYAEHNTPLAQPLPPVPAGGHPKEKPAPQYPKAVTDAFAGKNISVSSTQTNAKGTVTYIGSDGRQYRTGTDNIVRFWDGKEWQILK